MNAFIVSIIIIIRQPTTDFYDYTEDRGRMRSSDFLGQGKHHDVRDLKSLCL